MLRRLEIQCCFAALVFGHWLTLAATQFQPKAALYSALAGSGSFVKIPTGSEQISNLSSLNFNDRAKSVCLVGTWLFYDYENFNSAGNGGMEYVFEPKETCINFQSLGGYVSSLRAVGFGSDFRQDSVTLYADIYFQNDQELASGELAHLRLYGRIASLIITGSSDWTIYDEPNFGGMGICLKVAPTLEYVPYFVTDTTALKPTVPHGAIASLRKGCYADKSINVFSSPVPASDDQSKAKDLNPLHFVVPFFEESTENLE